jgi:predicted site-specific integrase-resolvase
LHVLVNQPTERPEDAQPPPGVVLYSTERAGEIIGVNAMTIRRMITSGELRVVDIAPEGSARPRYRVRSDDLARYINNRTSERGGEQQ